MKWLLILAVLAIGGYFAWQKYRPPAPETPAAKADPDKTPGADVKNRVQNLSGAAPE